MGTGLPDTTLFPIEDLRRYASLALDTYGAACLTYGMGGPGNFAGPLVLRQALARRTLAREGRDLGPDGIVLASGASHGIALAANAYLSPGDVVLAEELSWPWVTPVHGRGGRDHFACTDGWGNDVVSQSG